MTLYFKGSNGNMREIAQISDRLSTEEARTEALQHIKKFCDDHHFRIYYVIPINGWSEQGEDTLDNMLPACRSCNHYKSRSTLEGFRKMVENMPTVLMRDSVTYKNAVRFGLVTPTPHPVKFYFEQTGR